MGFELQTWKDHRTQTEKPLLLGIVSVVLYGKV